MNKDCLFSYAAVIKICSRFCLFLITKIYSVDLCIVYSLVAFSFICIKQDYEFSLSWKYSQ